jgi:hypothetical protein
MSIRAFVPACVLLVALASIAGCADGTGGRRDTGPLDARMDVSTPPDVPASDVPPVPDAGRGSAGACEACALDSDCLPDHFCAPLTSGGSACLPTCEIDLAECPARFECVANFTSTIPTPVCAPVGERCCVDEDGDLHGTGVGCLGTDCDDSSTEINSSASETCNGVDDDCDGTIDNGDPGILCPRGTHVGGTACEGAICTVSMCEPGFGDCNMMPDDGCETSTTTTTDCGSCGNTCALPHAVTHTCTGGECAIGTCEPGWGNCNGMPEDGCETELNTNTHCGGCGVTCARNNADSTCETGVCDIAVCSPRWGNCDGRSGNGCETPLTTNADCGSCGSICSPSSGTGDCSTGTCRVTTCAPGFEDCDASTTNGCETNIRSLTNCGGCGITCGFANGTASCAAGACSLVDCSVGFSNCDGISANGCETRVNTETSCGACGVACAPPHATGNCGSGTCAIVTCDPGWADCNGSVADGCETNTTTLTDCGSCRTACSRAGASADCSTGTCAIGTCNIGRGDCDGVDSNGCEVSLRTLTDCASCGSTCARDHSTPTCATGTCAVASCDPLWGNCNLSDLDGCEAPLTSLASCGVCGSVCTRNNASPTCDTGACRIDFCNPGFGNCDTVDANGCETPLNSTAHCGGCGVTCTAANASTTCSTGTCAIATCSPGWGNCDGLLSNGCERSLTTTTDCGGCGTACAPPHANGMCTSGGSCAIGSCMAGWADCNGSAADGCEVNIFSTSNCGGCGISCSRPNATATCSAGTCEIGSCNPGFGNCNGSSLDGCEASTSTTANCGSCGVSCSVTNGTASCDGTSCGVGACSAGFGNCNGLYADGCETSLNTISSCGSCGNACSLPFATPICSGGSCAVSSCDPLRANCNGSAGDGCEVSLASLANCGGCGVACSGPNATMSCSTGSCAVSSCAANFYDVDGVPSTGCECADDVFGGSCAAATSLGSVTTGAAVTRNGKIPMAGALDWFQVTFPATGGRPSISLPTNEGNVFRFDVLIGTCPSAIASCGAGAASGLTSWSFEDNVAGSGFTTRDVAWPTDIYIRVYRVSAGPSCANYTLSVTRP